MSNSLAKKRRVNTPVPPPPAPSNYNTPSALNPPVAGGGDRRQMTLPQVLGILEKRITALEKNNELKGDTIAVEEDDSVNNILNEYESRFEMLADQINYIKDTLMKLQTFTMDVNKTLLEEKNQIREQSCPIIFSNLELNEVNTADIIKEPESC